MDTKKLRQKILDLAIRGKLVPQDSNDEPASALLERIHAEKERLIKEGKIKRSKKFASDTPHYENRQVGEANEVPFEVPEGWELVKLSDIAVSELGKTLDKGKNSGTPRNYLCAFNVKWSSFDLSVIKKILLEDEELERYRVRKGDLLICEGGDVGRAAIWESDQDIYYQNALHRVRFKDEISQYFYLYVLQYYKSLGMIDDVSGGVTIKHFTQNSMKKLSFPLPPIAEQKRIVSAIKQWFALIDTLETAKEDLQTSIAQAKSKILDLAIHGKLVPQDPSDEPAIELLKRINPKFTPCDNAHDTNQLPDSWCWTTLGSIFQHNTGKALNKSNFQEGQLKPYLTTSNVYWNCFDFTEVKEMLFKNSELEKCTVTKGDLLVCEGGDIGRAAIWNYDYDICIQNHIHRLRTKGDICQILYLYILMLYKWKDRIPGKGIGLQGLSSGLLDKLVVPLPPYNEQQRVVTKIEEIFAVLDEIQKSIEA